MPRYLIRTSDSFSWVHDDEGVELPDTEALVKLLRQTLTVIMSDEGIERGRAAFWAEALNERDELVLAARSASWWAASYVLGVALPVDGGTAH